MLERAIYAVAGRTGTLPGRLVIVLSTDLVRARRRRPCRWRVAVGALTAWMLVTPLLRHLFWCTALRRSSPGAKHLHSDPWHRYFLSGALRSELGAVTCCPILSLIASSCHQRCTGWRHSRRQDSGRRAEGAWLCLVGLCRPCFFSGAPRASVASQPGSKGLRIEGHFKGFIDARLMQSSKDGSQKGKQN